MTTAPPPTPEKRWTRRRINIIILITFGALLLVVIAIIGAIAATQDPPPAADPSPAATWSPLQGGAAATLATSCMGAARGDGLSQSEATPDYTRVWVRSPISLDPPSGSLDVRLVSPTDNTDVGTLHCRVDPQTGSVAAEVTR